MSLSLWQHSQIFPQWRLAKKRLAVYRQIIFINSVSVDEPLLSKASASIASSARGGKCNGLFLLRNENAGQVKDLPGMRLAGEG